MSAPVFKNRARAESFGAVARDYERSRPSYPVALVDDLLALGPGEILDVGCGTGKAARLLAARGPHVLGVEIDEQMADVARSHGLDVEVAAFESWDAHGRTFDLLTCAQAWHWVDPEVGVPKAAEVVRPGGHVALFWNDDRLDRRTSDALADVYRALAPELVEEPAPDDDPVGVHRDAFAASPSFDVVATRTYSWQRNYTADEWVALCMTHSNHLVLPAARRAALAAALQEAVDRLGGVVAPYETYLILAERAA